ncbi:NAD-dependent deacylase [bacterium]|nr:NAD-dependent deacylase [bacterium]
MDLTACDRVVVLTGAGISVASGIRPFRGPGGWWTEDPEAERESASHDLKHYPERIWRLFGPLRKAIVAARPNPAHNALAELEARLGDRLTVVTQNVDGLHQRAGSRNVVELHGSLLRSRCSACDLAAFENPEGGPRPCDRCGSLLRPDIVLFGEPVDAYDDAYRAVFFCDLFLAVGTSGCVAPASVLVDRALGAGARTILINLEAMSPANPAFEEEMLGRAEEILPGLFQILSA